MDKLYGNPWVLRIFALVLALALFLYVRFENNLSNQSEASPTNMVELIENVPLQAYYDSENLIVSGLPETVDVTISGPSQLVLTTKLNKNFTVFVDLEDLMLGEHHVTIQHENISDKIEVAIDPVAVNITIEELVTQSYPVEPEINKTLIAEGYTLAGLSVDPDTVSITGAKSAIDSISFVKASVTEEKGLKESLEQSTPVRVLNDELNGLDVAVDPENVTVSVEIEEYNAKKPLSIQQTGELPENVMITSFTPEVNELTLKGKKAIIDELTNLVVEFDVAQLTDSGIYEAKVILPEGVTSNMKTIKIAVELEKRSQEAAQSNDSED